MVVLHEFGVKIFLGQVWLSGKICWDKEYPWDKWGVTYPTGRQILWRIMVMVLGGVLWNDKLAFFG